MDSMYDYRPERRKVAIIDECKQCGEFILKGDTYHEISTGIVHDGCFEDYKSSVNAHCEVMEDLLNDTYGLSSDRNFEFIPKALLEELRMTIGKVLKYVENREEYYGE